MGNSLMRQGRGGGLVPAACSWFLPGLGQLVNGDSDKALGVFAVVGGAALATQLPLIGGVAALVCAGSWVYGIYDAFRGKRR